MTTARRLRIRMDMLVSAARKIAGPQRRTRVAHKSQATRVWDLAASGASTVEIARSTGLARDAVELMLRGEDRTRTEDSAASGTMFRVTSPRKAPAPPVLSAA